MPFSLHGDRQVVNWVLVVLGIVKLVPECIKSRVINLYRCKLSEFLQVLIHKETEIILVPFLRRVISAVVNTISAVVITAVGTLPIALVLRAMLFP